MGKFGTDPASKKTFSRVKVLDDDGDPYDFSSIEAETEVVQKVLNTLEEMAISLRKMEFHLSILSGHDLTNEEF